MVASPENRVQIRAVVMALGCPDTKCKHVISSLEIFDSDAGKIEVLIGNPDA